MKKTVLPAILITIVMVLSAQTGAYDITYDEPIDSVIDKLIESDFTLAGLGCTSYVFSHESTEEETTVYVYVDPDDDTVVMWVIFLLIYEGIEDDVTDWMVSLHGDDMSYVDSESALIWTFSPTRWLQVGYDDSEEYVRIAYYNEEYLYLME
ncbi:MAG: hypothetical protein FJ042_07375 [Candidatus Cloacimonetes bacterium]|nr:hypothetical protein [Candidatus Cloacimonadota bacterium]